MGSKQLARRKTEDPGTNACMPEPPAEAACFEPGSVQPSDSASWIDAADQGGAADAPAGWDAPLEEDAVVVDLGRLERALGAGEAPLTAVHAAITDTLGIVGEVAADRALLLDLNGPFSHGDRALVDAAVKALLAAAARAGTPRVIPVIAATLALAPILLAIAVFLAITLYASDAGTEYDGKTNPVTGELYTSQEEYDRVRRLSPAQQAEERKKRKDEGEPRIHQANIHVQGDDITGVPNVSFTEPNPILKSQGQAGLAQVKSQCTRSQLRDREIAFQRAERFVDETLYTAGQPLFRTFQNPECRNDRNKRTRRVDVEIIRGTAFA